MARFIVVVLVLVAVAFLANKYLLGEGDPRPGQAGSAPAEKSGEKDKPAADPAKESTKAEAAAKNDLPDAAAAAKAVDAVDAAPDAEKPVDPREAAAADAVAAAEVETDLESEPGVEAKIDAPGAADEVPPADPGAVEESNEENLEAVEEKAK